MPVFLRNQLTLRFLSAEDDSVAKALQLFDQAVLQ